MGGLSRRFLNVIVDNRAAGVQTLRCIDLLPRHKLLFNAKPPTKPAKKKMVPLASPPRPSPRSGMRGASTTSHGGIGMHCCAAPGDRAALCLDRRSGRSVLLEADASLSRVGAMPCLHRPKLDPISLYLPDRAGDSSNPAPLDPAADGGTAGTFFVMDRIARPKDDGDEAEPFEALVSHDRRRGYLPAEYWERGVILPPPYSPAKFWECDVIPPPPPYIDDSTSCLEITSHAVISDNTICISIDGIGTYLLKQGVGTDYFQKSTYEWSEVGKWTLPFRGKVEYVPDLNLWFGFSSDDGHFAATDLSTMNMEDSQSQQPQLLGSWKELEPPQGWQQIQDPQLVSLGSGRFCTARFFHTGAGTGSGDESSIPPCSQNNATTVLTGVEVTVHGVNEQVNNLGMVKHKSRSHNSSYGEDTIVSLF